MRRQGLSCPTAGTPSETTSEVQPFQPSPCQPHSCTSTCTAALIRCIKRNMFGLVARFSATARLWNARMPNGDGSEMPSLEAFASFESAKPQPKSAPQHSAHSPSVARRFSVTAKDEPCFPATACLQTHGFHFPFFPLPSTCWPLLSTLRARPNIMKYKLCLNDRLSCASIHTEMRGDAWMSGQRASSPPSPRADSAQRQTEFIVLRLESGKTRLRC